MYNSKLSENETKGLVRESIINDLILISKSENKIGRILTLPCLNFDIEIEALKLNYKVNTCEIDTKVFYNQRYIFSNISREYLTFNNMAVSDFLAKHKDRKFDLCYLDFCGPICKELLHSLTSLIGRCGTLYITVLLQREHPVYNFFFKRKSKITDYENIFKFFGFETLKKFKYINNKFNMCTFKLSKINH